MLSTISTIIGHLAHQATTWTAVAITLGALVYVYFRHKFSYWSRIGLKNPTPLPWFGTGLWHIITPKPVLELEQHRKYGKLYGLYDGFLGTNPTLVCGHPEVIKQVTIKHFDSFTNRRKPATWKSIRYRALTYMRDDEWKNLRKILAPIFTSNKLKRMFELMKRCTKNLQDSIDQYGDQEVDLKKIFSVFTVDVISTCCFSMDLKDFRHPDSEILISARKFFNVSKMKMLCAQAIPKSILSLIGFDINDVDSISFFQRFATEVINARRGKLAAWNAAQKQHQNQQQHKGYKKQDDFLQTLIDAAAEFSGRNEMKTNGQITEAQHEQLATTTTTTSQQDVTSIKHEQEQQTDQPSSLATDDSKQVRQQQQQQKKPELSEQQLGDLEIMAQSMLFLAVGHETTATLLSNSGLFLSLYPDIQDRLYNEVHEAFVRDKGDLTYDTLMELQYLDAFVSEALRFFTPTLTFDREASEDVEIEVEGWPKFTIPKGMGIIIPFHAIHHDPDNYEDPERFDPERFMPENRHKIKPCTFIPFGAGPRFCLASRFALIEAKLALANLVHRYKFIKSEGTIYPPRFRHHYMLLQMEWPKIKFVDRKLDELSANCSAAAVATSGCPTTASGQPLAA